MSMPEILCLFQKVYLKKLVIDFLHKLICYSNFFFIFETKEIDLI